MGDLARDALRIFLMLHLPTEIANVNAARPTRTVADAVSTAGSATITSSTATFIASDVGEPFSLTAAGAEGRGMTGVVLSRVDPSTATVSPSPQTDGTALTLTIGKQPLASIARWVASPLVATPQPPAVGVLPQTSGFRGTQWQVEYDEQHHLMVYVQAANADEELLEQDIEGYGAAVVNTVIGGIKGTYAMPSGFQFLFGAGGEKDAEDCIVYGPKQPVASLFYGDVTVLLTLFNSESV